MKSINLKEYKIMSEGGLNLSNPIKVMIVDDAFMIRVIVRNFLDGDEQKRFKVVASAVNGEDAVEKALNQEVDVILMDIEMPKMNGLEALREIMKKKPTPVIMFSSLTKKGAKETIESLSLGAIDFIAKDKETSRSDISLKEEIFKKVIQANKINMGNIAIKKEKIEKVTKKREPSSKLSNLVTVGCSTGGPSALQRLFSTIDSEIKAGFVVVQHMPAGGYTESLAKHLNDISPLNVMEAKEGQEITDGNVYIAPGGYHLEVIKRANKYQISLNKKDMGVNHKPSVDIMLLSLARIQKPINLFSVIMTGMGSDGLNGIKEIKGISKAIITESQKTAVIYGMPKQIEIRGLSDYVVDLEEISKKIKEII